MKKGLQLEKETMVWKNFHKILYGGIYLWHGLQPNLEIESTTTK